MVFLLAHVEAELRKSRSMRSLYRYHDDCDGGNLLKIHLDDCTQGLCAAKLDGRSTNKAEASKGCYNATVRVNTCYQIAER